MCIVTNLKYIFTVCYDVIILYNFLPMHSFFIRQYITHFIKKYETFSNKHENAIHVYHTKSLFI